ncbi:MAG: iron donor protein CyaY [Planctomycetes bacterium]|nr:iron donor protein CyaY [Planctomycetota bacterium]MCB9912398.1 iron donor protein CyaY [Planctomycetota bacterium]
MERSQFLSLADACLNRVADWLEDFDPDEVDFGSSDGVVTLEFPDGTKYVLNRQAGNFQMWFAAGASAWHYDWSGDQWLCDKDSHPLLERIQDEVSKRLGRKVDGLFVRSGTRS